MTTQTATLAADRPPLPGKLKLLALAVVVGIAIPLAEQLIFAAVLGRSPSFAEADALVMNAVLTAIPFLFLAFLRPRRLPWLIAIGATVVVRGGWLAQGIAYQMAPDGTGVPIFGAVLLLFSPFAILILAGVVNGVMARRETASLP